MKRASIVAAGLLAAVAAEAAEYVFSNTAGGSVASATNWKDGVKPEDEDATATINAIAVTTGNTIDLGDGTYSWNDFWVGGEKPSGVESWTLSGGTLSLLSGFRLSNGTLVLKTQLAGTAPYVSRGTTLEVATAQENAVTLGVSNGRLVLSAPVATGTALTGGGSGIIEVNVDQTAQTLSGTHEQTRVALADGKSLTLNGIEGATEYKGNLTGSGTLVKKGAAYDLVFSGDHTTNHPFAGSVSVEEGSVTLKKARQLVRQLSPSLYWSFDDPTDPGKPDVGSLTFSPYTWDSSEKDNGRIASDVNLSSGGVHGRGVHPNGTVIMSVGKNGSMPRSNNSFTVLCWAKVATGATGVRQILGWGGRTTTSGSAFCLRVMPSGGMGVYTTYGENSLKLTANEKINYRDGRWHQVGATYDGTTVTAYVDGVAAGSVEVALAISDWNYFDIGLSSTGGNGSRTPCDLAIDELGVYNKKALTDDEIRLCYEAFRSVYDAETPAASLPDPVAWYRFDDASQIGKDSSGNGYHLEAFVGEGEKGTMRMPTVDANSPINGGMYSGRAGNGYLKWTGDVLPAKIPRGTDPSTVTLWVNASGSSERAASQSWAAFQLGNRRIGSAYGDNWRRFTVMSDKSNVLLRDSISGFIHKENRETAWHHLAYTHENLVMKFYVDGQLVDTKSSVKVEITDSSVFYLGQSADTYNASYQYFRGNLDEVKIYDSALTAEQIAADYRVALPRTENVISPDTALAVASGATVAVDGASQTLASLTGVGAVELKNDATLTLKPTAALTFDGTIGGCGKLKIVKDVTLAGSCDLSAAGGVEIAAATLTVSGTIGNSPITLKAGGALALAQATDADLVYESGSVLDMAHPLTTSGKVTLQDGFTVKAPAETTSWVTVLTAGAVDVSAVDIDQVTFRNLPQGTVGKLKLEDNVLKAKVAAPGMVLIFR